MWKQNELVCEPLDTYEDITNFIQNPPSWRSLCTELKPHSDKSIKNIENSSEEFLLELPRTFCHFDPDADVVPRHDRKLLPKTLVCHDMANGYHDDSIIDGTTKHDAYTFYNWAAIDIFCYFSHHLITIPPLGWINVGHAHGVKVIGTVITEWGQGVEFWEKILQSESTWQTFASALVAIAKTLKFDGWLLNIENKIQKPNQLLQFVKCLHTTLHQEVEDPILIWYDSVTITGSLNWQNGLNEKNMAFFDVVDGFFTNYSWTEEDVKNSAKEAGDRLKDLYIGIDVWGRNFYGGGQFNTQEAVELVHKNGCSLAIFAPAWTHEAAVHDKTDLKCIANAEGLQEYEHFLLRDRALWDSLWPFLNTKLPCSLPFQSSFCRGHGLKRRLYGEIIGPGPWYNLRHMQYQPNSAHGPHGYILSTYENISNLSRLGLLKDKVGILRYRRSIEKSKADVVSTMIGEENSEQIKEDSLTNIQEDEIPVQTNEPIPAENKSFKRKIKNSFRNLFKKKAARIDNEEHVTSENNNNPDEVEATLTQSSGRSMAQMSVSLHLGKSHEMVRFALAYVENEQECLEPFFGDSFLGGSCLKINPSDKVSVEHRLSRLFHCDFLCENSLIACVVTKKMVGHEDQFLNIKLEVTDPSGKRSKINLIGQSTPHSHEAEQISEVRNLYPLADANNGDLRELQKYILLNEPSFYVPLENAYKWEVRYYVVLAPGSRVAAINCRTGLAEGPVLLGYFGLCQKQ